MGKNPKINNHRGYYYSIGKSRVVQMLSLYGNKAIQTSKCKVKIDKSQNRVMQLQLTQINNTVFLENHLPVAVDIDFF